MTSLREQQLAFADALRANSGVPANAPAVRPIANLGIYRNNTDWQFRHALACSFPVLCRRVGDDFFRQLAFHYRKHFPSRSGDLHWVGLEFPRFLAEHLAGGDYAWLADLAALEWAREEASVAEELPALDVTSLAGFAPGELEGLTFRLQPSLKLGGSDYPVLSVWQANQMENAPPVDQSLGSERYLIHSRGESVMVAALTRAWFSFLQALQNGQPLGNAMEAASLDESGLLAALRFTFGEQLVVGLTPRTGS